MEHRCIFFGSIFAIKMRNRKIYLLLVSTRHWYLPRRQLIQDTVSASSVSSRAILTTTLGERSRTLVL
jgi:hypothetical protein